VQQQQSSQLSSTSATAAQLQLSYKTNKKIVLKFTDYAQNLNSKLQIWIKFCGQKCEFVHKNLLN
jgi:hypothetical protein